MLCYGGTKDAHRVFDEMPERDVVSLNAILCTYVDADLIIGLFAFRTELLQYRSFTEDLLTKSIRTSAGFVCSRSRVSPQRQVAMTGFTEPLPCAPEVLSGSILFRSSLSNRRLQPQSLFRRRLNHSC